MIIKARTGFIGFEWHDNWSDLHKPDQARGNAEYVADQLIESGWEEAWVEPAPSKAGST